MTAIINYGVGNLFSLKCSFNKISEAAVLTDDPKIIEQADRIVLPGVGAFKDAVEKLRNSGLLTAFEKQVAKGTPVLGICLGMQLLFDKSFEYGEHQGLGLITGEVIPLAHDITDLKIPHMGWNGLQFKKEHPLLKYIHDGDHVYFVHSYYAAHCRENTVAVAEYGTDVTAMVAKDNVMGCQFHPEKSGTVGLKILRAFCEMKRGTLC